MNIAEYETGLPGSDYYINCAFICVDLQNPRPGVDYKNELTENDIPLKWLQEGHTVDDVNRANRFLKEICEPNAARLTESLRGFRPEIPMIYIHWQARYEDMIDIDPSARRTLLADYTEEKQNMFINGVRSGIPCPVAERPLDSLKVRKTDYVLGKTAQDSFVATPLEFMLRNLKTTNLIFIGGHTGGCLGKTSITAKKLGFNTLCVADATFNAFESNRIKKIMECGYDFIVKTERFMSVLN